MAADTTVVITSCGRHDLLERTLSSFRAFNTDLQTGEVIVVEDGDGDPGSICDLHGAKLIRTVDRLGQIRAIDLAYRYVTTPFIFHCEDDWEFYRPGFVEASRELLKVDLSTMCVWLRAWDDTNGHPLVFASPCGRFGVLASDFKTDTTNTWHGFTFNPGLRRVSDYLRVGCYDSVPHFQGHSREADIGLEYHRYGYRAAILDRGGYVRHLGSARRVREAV